MGSHCLKPVQAAQARMVATFAFEAILMMAVFSAAMLCDAAVLTKSASLTKTNTETTSFSFSKTQSQPSLTTSATLSGSQSVTDSLTLSLSGTSSSSSTLTVSLSRSSSVTSSSSAGASSLTITSMMSPTSSLTSTVPTQSPSPTHSVGITRLSAALTLSHMTPTWSVSHSLTSSATSSASATPTRSEHTLAPWLIDINGAALETLPKVMLVTPTDSARFVLRTSGDFNGAAPTLTLRPTAVVATPSSSWRQQCRQGYPTLLPSTLAALSSYNDVVVGFSDITAALLMDNTSNTGTPSGTFVVCTTDGFFAGVVLAVLSVGASPTVEFADGSSLYSDRDVALPATSGQFAAWQVALRITFAVSGAPATNETVAMINASSVGDAYLMSNTVYAAPRTSACSANDALASFQAVVTRPNATALVLAVTIRSTDAEAIDATTTPLLQLCVLGNTLLNVTLTALRDVALNGGVVAFSDRIHLVAAVSSFVSPLELTTSSSTIDPATNALVFCTSQAATFSNMTIQVTDGVTPSTAMQSFSLSIPSNASSVMEVNLCLNLPHVPSLRGVLVVAVVVVVRVASVDGVAASATAQSPIAVFVGPSAPSQLAWQWTLPTLSSSFTTIAGDMQLLVSTRASNTSTAIAVLDSTVSTSTLLMSSTNLSAATWLVPSDWSSVVDTAPASPLGQSAQLLLSWRTAVSRTLSTPVLVSLLRFDVTLMRIDSIGTAAAPANTTVVFTGTTNASVRVSYTSLGSTVPGAAGAAFMLGALNAATTACSVLNTSSSPLGSSATVISIQATTLSSRLFFTSPSSVSTGMFCVQRTLQQNTFAAIGAFTVVSVAAFGNTTNVPQLMEIAAGHSAADRLQGSRQFPVSFHNIAAVGGSDILTAITILPCNTSQQSLIATSLSVDDSGSSIWLTVAWQPGSLPATASSTILLCGVSSSASSSETLALGATVAVHVLPRILSATAEGILLAGATAAQTLTIAVDAARTVPSSLTWTFVAVSTPSMCGGTALVRFSASAGSALVNASAVTRNTTMTVGIVTGGLTALEPSATLCVGLVNVTAITSSSTSVYVRLPFTAAALVLARYEMSSVVNRNVSLFPATNPVSVAAATIALYDYALTTVSMELNMTNASAVTASSGSTGLTVALALSPTSTCATVTPLALWRQGSGSRSVASLPVNTSQVLGDTLFLCVKLATTSYPTNTTTLYVWSKFYVQVIRASSWETSLSPLSYSTAGELLAVASATTTASISTLAAVSRTISVQGQNLDTATSVTLALYLAAGADCANDVADLVAATTGTTTSTRAVFTVPAVSSALVFQTVCWMAVVRGLPVVAYVNANLRIVAFASIGLPPAYISSRQQGIVAITSYVVNLTVYSPTGGAAVDPTTFQLLASNASSCGRGSTDAEVSASFTSLPMTVVSGVTQVSLRGLTTAGTYYLCYADVSEVFSVKQRATQHRGMRALSSGVASPIGVSITSIDLRLSSHALGSNASIGSLVNSTLTVPATGSLLGDAVVYISATDDTTCTSSALTGTTAYGNSRVPVLFSGCSGSAASATIPAATEVTGSSPMTLCLAVASSLDAAMVTSSTLLTFFDSGLRLAVVEPDALYVARNQSDSVSVLGTLDTQPLVGMLDGNSGVALSVIPTATVLQAEWHSLYPVIAATGETYTMTSAEGDTDFDFSKAATPVQLRSGKFGYAYALRFSVPTSSSSSIAFTTASSSNTSLDSCSSNLQWAVWYSSTCTTCPSNAICDGTPVFRVSGSYWRYSEYSSNLYSCGSPYMEDTCISNTSTGTCVTGHTGPRCSVCEEGYGLGSGYCVTCSGNEVSNGFIVFFAGLAIVVVIVVLVISTLQCKKSDQFPIYFKLLLNHLTQASTLGDFSTNLASSLTTLFKIQRQASRPSPAFAALTCTFGMDWYQQFISVTVFPGVVAGLLIIIFSVRQIISEVKERKRLGLSLANNDAVVGKGGIEGAAGGGRVRRKTVMFFAPKHEADESLIIDGVERTNSIAVLDLSNDASLIKSQTSTDGRPPLIIRRKNQNAKRPEPVVATLGADHEHSVTKDASLPDDQEGRPSESPPSAQLAPLDASPVERGDDDRHDMRHQMETPTAFELDEDDADISGSKRAGRKSSSRGTQLTQQSAAGISMKDIGMMVTSVEEGDHAALPTTSDPPQLDNGDKVAADEDDDDDEDDLDKPGLQRKNTELGLLEVHRSVVKAKARHLFMVIMIIVMFAAYPSIIEWCANVLRCDDIDIGEVQPDGTIASNIVEYFYYDRSKVCTSAEHKRYTAAGIALGTIYGFGTPICAVLLYLRLKRPKQDGGVGFVDASRMFTFLIAGYRRDVWWWEAVVMLRKLLLIYISAFLTDSTQQTLCAFWAICFYLLAHEVVRPYEYDTVDRMERYSLIVICLTLNFSMAYSWLDAQDTPARKFGYWAISVFLLVINIVVVAWMLYQILVEGSMKVRKFLFLHSATIKAKFPPRIAECILQLAYKPPEMVEVLPDGNIVEVTMQDIPHISVEEHQAFLDADESGSDWSDEEEFLLEDGANDEDIVVAVDAQGGGLHAGHSANDDPSNHNTSQMLQASNLNPGAVTSGASTPRRDEGVILGGGGPIIGSLRNRLKSISNMFGLRARAQRRASGAAGSVTSPTASGVYPQHYLMPNQSLNVSSTTPDAATIAAQDALAQLESAFTARNHNTVTQLRAIIDGMQSHSDALIAKYTTLKQNLQQKTEELEVCKKHKCKSDKSDATAVSEKDIREHVGRLQDLESMAEALREENESLKDQLQMAKTTYSPRSESPSNQRLVDALRAEREELLRRLAEHDMAFRGSLEDSGRRLSSDASTLLHGTTTASVEQRLRELALKAEEEEAAANALAEAERDAQMRMIQEQLNAKRMARMARSTNPSSAPSGTVDPLPPTSGAYHRAPRKSLINNLVDKITEEVDDFDGDADAGGAAGEPPNPFRSTISPRDSLNFAGDLAFLGGAARPAASRPGSARMGILSERLEVAMRSALARTGTMRSLFSAHSLVPQASPAPPAPIAPLESLGLSAAFPEENFTAAAPDEEGRVLVIKRRHPKMRAPEFLAPWGHSTWQAKKKPHK